MGLGYFPGDWRERDLRWLRLEESRRIRGKGSPTSTTILHLALGASSSTSPPTRPPCPTRLTLRLHLIPNRLHRSGSVFRRRVAHRCKNLDKTRFIATFLVLHDNVRLSEDQVLLPIDLPSTRQQLSKLCFLAGLDVVSHQHCFRVSLRRSLLLVARRGRTSGQ